MRIPGYTAQFRRDYKRAESRGKNLDAIDEVMHFIVSDSKLPARYRDHQLKGKWKNFRELHVEPDWLLVYRLFDDKALFHRTGTHSDIFGE